MANGWLTPGEISQILGKDKIEKILHDLVQEEKSRPEVLQQVTEWAKCNEYSASDFLREIVKNPPK